MATSNIIITGLSLLALAAAQSSTTSNDTSSGYAAPAPAGDYAACPSSVDDICAVVGSTTFCYDESSVLYTLTCNASFIGTIYTGVNTEVDSVDSDSDDDDSTATTVKSKRDFFDFPYVTLADCTTACDSRPDCLAVNVMDGSSCMLLETIVGMNNSSPGTVAAYKGYWAPNATIPSRNGTNGTDGAGFNFTLPGNFSLPGNFTLPPNITFPDIPSNVSVPANETVPANSTTAVADPVTTDLPLNTTVPDSTTVSADPTTTSADIPTITSNSTVPDNSTTPYNATYPSGNYTGPPSFNFTIPSFNSSAPAGFPDASAFPTCDSVTCSLAGTASTPFCHDDLDQLYTVNCGVTFLGTTMSEVPDFAATLSGCADACDDLEGCQAVNFDMVFASCTLVSGVTGIDYSAPNVIGLWQGHWAQQASNSTGSYAPTGTGFVGTAPVSAGFPAPTENATIPANSTIADPITTADPSSVIPTPSTNATTELLTTTSDETTTASTGFPTLSANSTDGVAGPTGTGAYPTASIPTGFPGFSSNSTGGYGNYSACDDSMCDPGEGVNVCTDVSGQVYTVNCGLTFSGVTGINTTAASLSECQAMCDDVARCLAVNYGYGQCQAVFTVSGINYPAPGWTGAWRGIWQGGAPPAGNSTGGYPGNFTIPGGNFSIPSGSPVNSANSTGAPSTATSGFPVNSANATTSSTIADPVTTSAPASITDISLTTYTTTCTENNTEVIHTHSAIVTANITSNATTDPVASTTFAGTAATSGFPYNSANGSYPAGPTGFVPTGGYPRPPLSTGTPKPSNASFSDCSASACVSYGAAYCSDTQAQLYTVNCGLMFQGVSNSSLVSATPDDCAAACDADSSCLAYNFANGTCDFFSVVTGVQYPAPGYIAAWKGYWAGGAPPAASSGFPVNSANATSAPYGTGISAVPTNSANVTDIVSASPTNSANITSTVADPVTISRDPSSPVSGLPTISANTTSDVTTSDSASVPLGTATSGIPYNSVNGSYPAGPTGFVPTGVFPGPPQSTGAPVNVSSCAVASCEAGSVPCTDSTGVLYTLNCGTQFLGPATNTSASSLDACQQVCDGQSSCLAVNFNGAQCQIVIGVTGIQTPAPGWTAAWKGYWAGGAPAAPSGGFPVPSYNGSGPASSGAPVNSANATTSAPLATDPATTSLPADTTSSSPLTTSSDVVDPITTSATDSTTSSATISLGTATSGFPVNSANSSYSAGPTGFPSPPGNATNSLCGNGTSTTITDSHGQLYTINCGLSFQGNVSLTTAADPGLEGCAETCDSLPICLGFNFNGQSCDFIASVAGVSFGSPMSIGAWRGEWAGGAPGAPAGGNGSFAFPGGNSSFPIPGGNGSFPIPSGNGTEPITNSTIPAVNTTTSSDPAILSTTSSASASISIPTVSANTTSSDVLTSTSVGPISTGTGSPAPAANASSTYSVGPISTGSPAPSNETYPVCSPTDCSAQFCVDEAGSLYSVTCDKAWTGTTLDITAGQVVRRDGATILDCEASCDSSSACIAANYDGFCTYFSAVNGMVSQNGTTALWKGYWGSNFAIPSFNGTAPGGNSSFPGFPAGNSSFPGHPSNETSPVNGSIPDTQNITSSATTSIIASTSSILTVTDPAITSSSTSAAPNTTSSFVDPSTTSASSAFPAPSPNSTTESYTIGPISTGSPSPNSTLASCAAVVCSAPYQQSSCQDGNGQTYTITCGVAFTGNFESQTYKRSASTLLDCESACDGDAACVALNFDGSSCAYLTAVNGTSVQEGSIAAWKGVWVGGAPSTNGSAPFIPPFNSTGPSSGHFPLPSDNATTPAGPTAPVTVSASTTSLSSSTISSSSSSSSAEITSSSSTDPASPETTSSTSSESSSTSVAANTTSSTVSVPLTTGSPIPVVNGTIPSNHTVGPCEAVECFAPFQQSFCTDNAGQVYTLTCGVAFQGTPVDSVPADSLSGCQAGCDASPACLAANFGSGTCTQISSVTGIQPVNGSVAAWKGIWAGGAPTNGSAPYPSFNGTAPLPPVNGSFPGQPTNASATSSTPVDPATTSLVSSSTVIISTISDVSTSTSSSSSLTIATTSTASSTSSLSSSIISTSSSTTSSSVPLTTGTPGFPTGNSTLPANITVSSCDAPVAELCAAGYGLGASSFCKDTTGQVYTITCGVQFQGPSLANTTAASLEACTQYCDGSAACVALNFGTDGSCSLVSAIYGVNANATGSIAAYRGIWVGGAPSGPAGGNSTVPFPLPGGNYTIPPTTGSVIPPSSTVPISSSAPVDPVSNSASPTSSPSSLSSTASTTSSSSSSVPASTSTASSSASASSSSSVPIGSGPSGPGGSVSSTASQVSTSSAPSTPVSTGSGFPLCSVALGGYCSSSNATFCSDTTGQTWTLNCNSAFNGTILSNQEILKRQVSAASATILDCEAVCDSQTDCVALNFANSSCTLLSSINGINKVSGSIAAYKGYWPQAALGNGTAPISGSPLGPTGLPPFPPTTAPLTTGVSSSSVPVVTSSAIPSSSSPSSATTSSSSSSSSSVASSSTSSSATTPVDPITTSRSSSSSTASAITSSRASSIVSTSSSTRPGPPTFSIPTGRPTPSSRSSTVQSTPVSSSSSSSSRVSTSSSSSSSSSSRSSSQSSSSTSTRSSSASTTASVPTTTSTSRATTSTAPVTTTRTSSSSSSSVSHSSSSSTSLSSSSSTSHSTSSSRSSSSGPSSSRSSTASSTPVSPVTQSATTTSSASTSRASSSSTTPITQSVPTTTASASRSSTDPVSPVTQSGTTSTASASRSSSSSASPVTQSATTSSHSSSSTAASTSTISTLQTSSKPSTSSTPAAQPTPPPYNPWAGNGRPQGPPQGNPWDNNGRPQGPPQGNPWANNNPWDNHAPQGPPQPPQGRPNNGPPFLGNLFSKLGGFFENLQNGGQQQGPGGRPNVGRFGWRE